MTEIGKGVVGLGVGLVIVGLILWFGGDKLSLFGRLPGDIRVERPGFSLYFPITTMIVVSIVLTLVLSLIGRFFK